jgi:hypothetical protein
MFNPSFLIFRCRRVLRASRLQLGKQLVYIVLDHSVKAVAWKVELPKSIPSSPT